jgi:signal transduction histidine kinase
MRLCQIESGDTAPSKARLFAGLSGRQERDNMSKCFLPRCFRGDKRLSEASRLVIFNLTRPRGFEPLTFAFGGCGLPAADDIRGRSRLFAPVRHTYLHITGVSQSTMAAGRDGLHSLQGVRPSITGRKRKGAVMSIIERSAPRSAPYNVLDLQRTSDFQAVLLGMAGHDLRQPLQVIRGIYELLGTRARPKTEQVWLERGERAVSGLTEQLDRLLGALRLYEYSKTMETSSVALAPLLRRRHSEIEGAALQRGVSLRVCATQGHVMSNLLLLGGVLRNLVSNAVKYTEPGGRILIGCRRSGHRLLEAGYAQGGGHIGVFEKWWSCLRDDDEFAPDLCFLAVNERRGISAPGREARRFESSGGQPYGSSLLV